MKMLLSLRTPGVLGALALAAPCSFGQGLGPPPVPAENPITAEKALLGQAIFWDEQLSSLDTTACATCHLPEAAGADPRTLLDLPGTQYIGRDRVFGTPDDTQSSPGLSSHFADRLYRFKIRTGMGPQLTIRNTPLVFDSAYPPEVLLDGRATESFTDPMTGVLVSTTHAALETQALLPFVDEKEMGWFGRPFSEVIDDFESVEEALALAENVPPALASWIAGRDYGALFDDAFGSPGITTIRIAQALATFERTLVTHGHLPFDDFLNGNPNALTPLEAAGWATFQAVGCADCHPGAILSDHTFRAIGNDLIGDELGRGHVTQDPADDGKFRVPTLRNVALTAPYFHDGSATTLEDVIDFFDIGGTYDHPNKDPLIVPLGLTQQQKDELLAFLTRPLTDPRAATFSGPYARLGLYSESLRAPEEYGVATAGSNGEEPKITLLEPTRIGRTITVAVEAGTPGAPAALVVSPAQDPFGSTFQGVQLFVGLVPGTTAQRVPLSTNGLGPGSASLRLTLPNDPTLVGTSLFAQWLIYDPTPSARLAASPAVRMHLID